MDQPLLPPLSRKQWFKPSWRTPALVAGVALLLVTNVATVAALMVQGRRVLQPAPNYAPAGTPDGSYSPEVEGSSPTSPADTQPAPKLESGQMEVTWYRWPVLGYPSEVMEYKVPDPQDGPSANWVVYKVGVVARGPYQGQSVYDAQLQGMGTGLYRLIVGPYPEHGGRRSVVVVTKNSSPLYGKQEGWVENDKVSIANLEPPLEIAIPNSSLKLERSTDFATTMLLQVENPQPLFEYIPGEYVYFDRNHDCFVVQAKDGSVRTYYFGWKFIAATGKRSQYNGAQPFTLSFTSSDGRHVAEEYLVHSYGGCGGYGSCYKYADYLTSDSQVEPAGTTSDGQTIYGLKDTNVRENRTDEKTLLRTMYDNIYTYGNDSSKPSYEAFVADHPVLYWKDPFGRYIQFSNAKYLPAVECGKPVIYLYPTKEMDVTVQVAPTGGFSHTEPVYPAGGWKVRAKPSGELTYYADGQKYPYLFWEGFGLNYERPREGFVVAREDVEAFLRTTLPKLGLVQHEYDEFISYWLPKMQAKPYYFVTFVPQNEFDNLAPLNVSPKPDTVIRVFMDYEGLNGPIAATQPKLVTPQRSGFTVVEWGGALRAD